MESFGPKMQLQTAVSSRHLKVQIEDKFCIGLERIRIAMAE